MRNLKRTKEKGSSWVPVFQKLRNDRPTFNLAASTCLMDSSNHTTKIPISLFKLHY